MIEQSKTFKRLNRIAVRKGMTVVGYGTQVPDGKGTWSAHRAADKDFEQAMPVGKAEDIRRYLNDLKDVK